MTAIELAKTVKIVRDAQREYFFHRTIGNLNESKKLERALDKLVAKIIENHPMDLPEFNEIT